MLPPARHQAKVDPETLIHDIEEDGISQFVWTIAPKISQGIRKLVDIVGASPAQQNAESLQQANIQNHS